MNWDSKLNSNTFFQFWNINIFQRLDFNDRALILRMHQTEKRVSGRGRAKKSEKVSQSTLKLYLPHIQHINLIIDQQFIIVFYFSQKAHIKLNYTQTHTGCDSRTAYNKWSNMRNSFWWWWIVCYIDFWISALHCIAIN